MSSSVGAVYRRAEDDRVEIRCEAGIRARGGGQAKK